MSEPNQELELLPLHLKNLPAPAELDQRTEDFLYKFGGGARRKEAEAKLWEDFIMFAPNPPDALHAEKVQVRPVNRIVIGTVPKRGHIEMAVPPETSFTFLTNDPPPSMIPMPRPKSFRHVQFYSQRWNHIYFKDTVSYGFFTRYTWFEWYEESKIPRPVQPTVMKD